MTQAWFSLWDQLRSDILSHFCLSEVLGLCSFTSEFPRALHSGSLKWLWKPFSLYLHGIKLDTCTGTRAHKAPTCSTSVDCSPLPAGPAPFLTPGHTMTSSTFLSCTDSSPKALPTLLKCFSKHFLSFLFFPLHSSLKTFCRNHVKTSIYILKYPLVET